PMAAGAPTVIRVHVDPVGSISPKNKPDPEVQKELLEQMTGDIEIATGGKGLVGFTTVIGLKDPAKVLAYVKKRCAETGGSWRRYALDNVTVRDKGCTAVLDPSMLVEGDKLVFSAGGAGVPAPAARQWQSLVEGAAATGALGAATEALVAFTRSPSLG